MIKVNNKDSRTTSLTSSWPLYCYLLKYLSFLGPSTVDCEQANICWELVFNLLNSRDFKIKFYIIE